MHTAVSDGTDTPAEIIEKVKQAGVELFSVTDHDAIKGGAIIKSLLKAGDPAFITGIEFSCKDSEGQYHILGYNYDEKHKAINDVVNQGHGYRVSKLKKRLDYLKKEFGFSFSETDEKSLFALDNPGKPHVANMMVKYGFAPDKQTAIQKYINGFHSKSEYVRPEEAIKGILDSGGIPVLAHPVYGRGDDIILGEDLEKRVKKLISFGLLGVEAFYSGFTDKMIKETLALAEKYDLFVTAGSDYHGKNKMVPIGDTNIPDTGEIPDGLAKFINKISK